MRVFPLKHWNKKIFKNTIKRKQALFTKPLITDFLGCKYTPDDVVKVCMNTDNTPFSVLSMEVLKHNCNIVWFICMSSVGDISVILFLKSLSTNHPKAVSGGLLLEGRLEYIYDPLSFPVALNLAVHHELTTFSCRKSFVAIIIFFTAQ